MSIFLNGVLWSTCRVQPSDRIKLSVSKVTSEQYEQLYYDIPEIRTLGKMLLYTPMDFSFFVVGEFWMNRKKVRNY